MERLRVWWRESWKDPERPWALTRGFHFGTLVTVAGQHHSGCPVSTLMPRLENFGLTSTIFHHQKHFRIVAVGIIVGMSLLRSESVEVLAPNDVRFHPEPVFPDDDTSSLPHLQFDSYADIPVNFFSRHPFRYNAVMIPQLLGLFMRLTDDLRPATNNPSDNVSVGLYTRPCVHVVAYRSRRSRAKHNNLHLLLSPLRLSPSPKDDLSILIGIPEPADRVTKHGYPDVHFQYASLIPPHNIMTRRSVLVMFHHYTTAQPLLRASVRVCWVDADVPRGVRVATGKTFSPLQYINPRKTPLPLILPVLGWIPRRGHGRT